MLSYGSFMFSGADELADELWRTLSQWGGLLVEKGGRWNAGTLYEEAHPIKNYITFIGSPSLVTVGYCGDENFVSRICDLTADFWPRVGAENFESAFVAFNEESGERERTDARCEPGWARASKHEHGKCACGDRIDTAGP